MPTENTPLNTSSDSNEYRSFCDIVERLRRNEVLAHAITLNAVGDTIWSGFSYKDFNYAAQQTTDTNFDPRGQWAGQELYVSTGLILAAIAGRLGYAAAGKPFPTADVAAIVTATICSVFTWDYFQFKGAQWAQNAFSVSSNTANYLSSITAGLADGATQMIMISLVTLLTKETEWSKFKSDPANYLKSKSKELGLSLFPGLIPGAVWQLVFNFCVTLNLGPAATVFAVAIIVAATSIAITKLNSKILKSECCQNFLCKTTTMPTQNANNEKQEAPCVSLFNFASSFFGGSTKKPAPLLTTIQFDEFNALT